jgi:hypothetical protein
MFNLRRVTAEVLLISTATCAAFAADKSSKGTGTGGAGGGNAAQGQAAGATASNAPFESVMLAYGALDQTMQALARRACLEAKRETADTLPPLIVIIDQASLANLAAYDAFDKTARFLQIAFNSMTPPRATPAAATGGSIDTFADITNAIAAVLIASNTDTASTITIQDASAAVKLSAYLAQNSDCQKTGADVVYPGIYGTAADLEDFESTLKDVSNARADALKEVAKVSGTGTQAPVQVTAFNSLDATYNQFLQSWFAINGTTGQSGLAPIVQGYGLRKRLREDKRQVYEVYVNVAAGGGTQRVRKNALTALVTGDWISYSGGVIVNTMIFRKGDKPKVLYSDVLRYRTPLTRIQHPVAKDATHYGDNLGDTCPAGNPDCSSALKQQ